MDVYRTFYEGTLDPNRGHDRTLKEFNYSKKLVTPNDTLYLLGSRARFSKVIAKDPLMEMIDGKSNTLR